MASRSAIVSAASRISIGVIGCVRRDGMPSSDPVTGVSTSAIRLGCARIQRTRRAKLRDFCSRPRFPVGLPRGQREETRSGALP